MHTIRATWKHGRIVRDVPFDWPEGCRLTIEPEIVGTMSIGACDEDWSNSPEAVADWLASYDSLEPLEFTPVERADLAEWRQKVEEYTIANMYT
jgi:hypothetical protein